MKGQKERTIELILRNAKPCQPCECTHLRRNRSAQLVIVQGYVNKVGQHSYLSRECPSQLIAIEQQPLQPLHVPYLGWDGSHDAIARRKIQDRTIRQQT